MEDLKQLFSRVIEDNKQRILRFCRVYANGIEDQKDLYQDVALSIWNALPKFRGESDINTWVYRVCLNVCISHKLKFEKRKHLRLDIEGITIPDENANIHNNIDAVEKRKKMYGCISELNEADKMLVLLFLEDLPYKTIADITGLRINNIAVKISRIKKKLFDCLNN